MNLTSEIEQKVNELVKKFGAEEKATIIFPIAQKFPIFNLTLLFLLQKFFIKRLQ